MSNKQPSMKIHTILAFIKLTWTCLLWEGRHFWNNLTSKFIILTVIKSVKVVT